MCVGWPSNGLECFSCDCVTVEFLDTRPDFICRFKVVTGH